MVLATFPPIIGESTTMDASHHPCRSICERVIRISGNLTWVIVIVPALLLSLPSTTVAEFMVTVGGLANPITKGGPNDTSDPKMPNVISFNSQDPNKGFKTATGDTVSGTVTLAGGGALNVSGAANIINLTNLVVGRPANATGGLQSIVFQQTFANPAAPIFGAYSVFGNFANAGGTVAGSFASFTAFVNNRGLGMATNAIGFGPSPTPIGGGAGPLVFPAAVGPPWTLQGQVGVIVGAAGDTLNLPNSFEIGISDQPIFPIPEPSAIILFSMGITGVIFYNWIRRERAANRKGVGTI